MDIILSYIIFICCSLLFLISITSLLLVKNISNASPRFFLMVSGNYALMGTNLISMVFLIVHMNPSLRFIFHFHSIMQKSGKILFALGPLKIDYFSIFIIVLYPIILLLSLILSQSILFVISKWLNEPSKSEHEFRINNLIANNTWLEDCSIHLITDTKLDAMAYTLIRISKFRLKTVNIIVITTAYGNLHVI